MIKRLYRFMNAENAIKTIDSWQLRVGRICELNDPFEFIPGLINVSKDVPEHIVQNTQATLLNSYNKKKGILCFSDTIKDPVIWSHYADSHKGIAFGFDYDMDDSILKVVYDSDRVIVDLDNYFQIPEDEKLELINSVLSSKAPSWSYEQEYRVLVNLDECDLRGGHYFKKIPDDFLYEIVLGIRCPHEENYFKRALRNQVEVSVKRAKRDICQYKVNI